MKDDIQIKIREYLNARRNFLNFAIGIESLSGNDNIIGRIGEYIAFEYLDYQKRNPIKVTETNQPGYDIECDNKKTKVSVKLITGENKKGRTTKIKEPWDELILILINKFYEIEKLGHISKNNFKKGLKNNDFKGAFVYASRTMVNDNGIITKYGNVITDKSILYSLFTMKTNK